MSTHPLRTNPVKEELRFQVYRLLREAMLHAGIKAAHCDPYEDRGDGVLVLVHPVDEVPKSHLLSRLAPRLAHLLTEYNRSLPAQRRGRHELRLRMVVHAGEVHRDANGYFGESLDVAFRLLDSPHVKKRLQAAAQPMVLVVSEDIYWAIVKHEYDGICRASYLPQVRVQVAGRRRCGWVCCSPGSTAQRPLEVQGGEPRSLSSGHVA